MKWSEIKPLLEKYEICPDCGNRCIGNGQGGIEIDDDYFKRTCKCGFEVTVRGGIETTARGG